MQDILIDVEMCGLANSQVLQLVLLIILGVREVPFLGIYVLLIHSLHIVQDTQVGVVGLEHDIYWIGSVLGEEVEGHARCEQLLREILPDAVVKLYNGIGAKQGYLERYVLIHLVLKP
jgi:hypothetical protein